MKKLGLLLSITAINVRNRINLEQRQRKLPTRLQLQRLVLYLQPRRNREQNLLRQVFRTLLVWRKRKNILGNVRKQGVHKAFVYLDGGDVQKD